MLIIISDLHLGDGTCGKSISSDAFYVFAERLDEMAMRASWREDGSYHPIEQIDILLLGDILDPLHSTLWLDTELNSPEYTRPWTDQEKPAYAEKLKEITRAILKKNADSVQVLRELKVEIPQTLCSQRNWEGSKNLAPVEIHLHYMIGNHDWYYGVPGTPFDEIRAEVVEALGLSQDSSPFPYHLEDDPALAAKMAEYKVYARHGDCYDSFNYDAKKGRIHSALGDIFTVEILNRFPLEMGRRLENISPEIVESFSELSHVRPVLATSLWLNSQIKHNNLSDSLQDQIKSLWEELGDEFLALDVVRAIDKKMEFDSVDKLELALQLSKWASFQTINDITLWVQEKIWGGKISYARKALQEPAYKKKKARYIVYGHTHHHEVVPLDTTEDRQNVDDQIYFNSGTWHTYFDLAIHKPYEQKFVPYQVVAYLLFYKDDQRKGRRFETLSGIFS